MIVNACPCIASLTRIQRPQKKLQQQYQQQNPTEQQQQQLTTNFYYEIHKHRLQIQLIGFKWQHFSNYIRTSNRISNLKQIQHLRIKKHQIQYKYQHEILNLLRILQDFDIRAIIQQKTPNTHINNNKNNICRKQKQHQQAHKEQRNTQNIWPLMKYDVLLTK